MTSPQSAEPAPFLIRPAEARDADAIATVHRTAMREALPYLPDLHTAEEDRAWVANVVLPRQEVWVAEAAGRVVGVAALDGEMLAQLYILPGEQGRGIGSALLATAMARHPAGMRLYAFQRNTRARGFYERRGFVAVEFGDGSGNEEGEPDVLYEWTPTTAEGGEHEESAPPPSSEVQAL
jgi:GNAT superfamily N-acetyltransferase